MRHTTEVGAVVCVAVLLVGRAGAAEVERLLVYPVERISASEAPRVDGELSEAAWREKAAITALRNFLGPLAGELPSQRSEFTLLTDGTKLYIGATFHEQDMATVRYNPAAEPFWNDCIELYFDPAHDGSQQIQLVVDCGGRRWWHKQFNKGYGWWDDAAWFVLADWEAASARQAASWTIELALDCKSFGIDARPGKLCRFNACRFRLGGKEQEFTAWGFDATSRQKATRAWGHLVFGAPGERLGGLRAGPREVAMVYPDLGDRVVEVATDSGFEVFSRQGQKSTSFADLAAALMQRLNEQRRGAEGAGLADLDAQAAELEREARAEGLTLGAYDRLADRATKLGEQYEAVLWRARLGELVDQASEGRR